VRRQRLDSFNLDARQMMGNRLRVQARMSKGGNVQHYQAADGRTIKEYRPESEVFDAESLASAHGAPVTYYHPSTGAVIPDSFSRDVVGHIDSDVRRGDDGEHTQGTIWIGRRDAIDGVLGGALVELSAGYSCDLVDEAGVSPGGEPYDCVQKNIRWDHCALLNAGQARAGRGARILDSAEPVRVMRLDATGNAIPPAAPAQENSMTDHADAEKQIETLTAQVASEKARADTAESTIADANATLARVEGERDAAKSDADAAVARAEKAEGELAALAKAKADAEAEAVRVAVLADAKLVAGETFACDGDADAIRAAACTACGVTVDGKHPAYVEGRFSGLLEARKAGEGRTIGDARLAVVGGGTTPPAAVEPVETVTEIFAAKARGAVAK